VGSSYAHFDAQQGPGLVADVALTIVAFAAALGVNLVDYAWGLLGAPLPDPKAAVPEPLSGVGTREAAIGGVAAVGSAALCGIGLASLSGSAPLGYGTVAVLLGLARGAPAIGLDALGWRLGALAEAVAFGPLAATAGYAAHAGRGSSGAWIAGIPAGLVAVAALYDPSRADPDTDPRTGHGLGVALPFLAAAAIAIAARFWDYGAWASAGAVPMIVAAVAAWRLPAPPTVSDAARWGRLALVCAALALSWIIVALWALSPP
jgi:hypothetical protein